jgi:predicted alpha/beta superfamily hydrolase
LTRPAQTASVACVRATSLALVLLTACSASHMCPAVSGPAPVPASTLQPAPAAASPTAIQFGQTFRLSSAVLGEERLLNVYLPPGYEPTDGAAATRYPVLYALDGGMEEDFPHITGVLDVSIRNEVIRPLIVVGIQNTERRRDLVSATAIPKEQQIAPHAGGTDRFRRFLREELQPEIARRYRVSDDTAVVGESFAGLFVLETLLQDPDLFDTYIAIDPSVWWNGGALVKSAPQRFARWSSKSDRRLFVATADAKEMQDGVTSLMTALHDARPQGLTATYDPLPAEHHSTIFPVAEIRAYRVLFPVARP